MNDNRQKTDQALILAKNITEERLKKVADYGPYLHAREQIMFIEGVLATKDLPSDLDKDFVDIALMAIKELDADDPEYSEALCELSYWFKKL
jgi:hypothetical protein